MAIVKSKKNCIVEDFLKSLTGQGKIPNLQGINPAGMNPLELREKHCNPTQLGIFPGFFLRVYHANLWLTNVNISI